MSGKRVVLWPVYAVGGWLDDYPIRAVGLFLFLGATIALFLSVDTAGTTLAYDGVRLSAVEETVFEQPAYAVGAAVGIGLLIFYDG